MFYADHTTQTTHWRLPSHIAAGSGAGSGGSGAAAAVGGAATAGGGAGAANDALPALSLPPVRYASTMIVGVGLNWRLII